MKILLFGATGMIGQGVLRECLHDPAVTLVRTVGRSSTGVRHPLVQETLLPGPAIDPALEPELTGFDACFFCLGVSSVGMQEAAYARITFDLTLAVATVLARLNPAMTLIYVSGQGTDSSEQGRVMWARVKGRTENALLRLPFRAAYMFRPGFIQPMHGIKSRTAVYQFLYALLAPLGPILKTFFADHYLTTEMVGRAMLAAARHGAPAPRLESRDIRALAAGSSSS